MSPQITLKWTTAERAMLPFFYVCSDHQSNAKKISIKFRKKIINRSQEKEERKITHKTEQK